MKLRKKDFLRTESPAKKMMGGRKYLQGESAGGWLQVAGCRVLAGLSNCRVAGSHEAV